MTPEVQARYCELAMKGFDDATVLEAAEEAALTLDRRPTPGEFRQIAFAILERRRDEQHYPQLRAQHRQDNNNDDTFSYEEYVEEALERFKATNPTPEQLETYTNALRTALEQENYVRVSYLATWPEQAYRIINRLTKPLDKTQQT